MTKVDRGRRRDRGSGAAGSAPAWRRLDSPARRALGFSQPAVNRAVDCRAAASGLSGRVCGRAHGSSLHGECLAAVLAVGPGALLSYYSAGWLWGLWRGSPKPIHVTAFVPRHHPAPKGITRHRARNLVEADRALVDGIPVTSVARTILDLAWKLRGDQLARLLAQAEDLGLLDLDELYAVIERNRGHHGAKRLRHALATYERPIWTRSIRATFRRAPHRRRPTATRNRLERGRLRARRLLARAPLRASNSTPSRPTATARPSRATMTATWPRPRRDRDDPRQRTPVPPRTECMPRSRVLERRRRVVSPAPSGAVDLTGAIGGPGRPRARGWKGRPRSRRRAGGAPPLSAGRCRGAWRP